MRGGCCGFRRLLRSDGTPEGTFRFDSGQLRNLTILHGALYYFHHAFDAYENTAELWRSDATVAGTTLVTEITPGIPSDAYAATVVDGRVLFFRYAIWPLPGSLSLWSSDGTAEGTRMVVDIGPFAPPRVINFPYGALGDGPRSGGTLFFGVPSEAAESNYGRPTALPPARIW